MGQRILKSGLVAILATVALAGSAGSAGAGQYHVYSCRMPNGAPAPVDGWVGSVAAGGSWDQFALNTCETGGALVAALGDETVHQIDKERAMWTLSAPSFAHLVAASLWRSGDTAGGGIGNDSYQFWVSSPPLGSPTPLSEAFDECDASSGCRSQGESKQPLVTANRVVAPPGHLASRLVVGAGCIGKTNPEPYECEPGKGDAANYAAVIYLYAADLTLEQTTGPSAGGMGGELATAPTVAGTSDVTFNASDPGAGVYEAVFSVEGKVVQSTVIDEEGGRCRNVGQTSDGLPAFLLLQPCPPSVSADIGFDTTRVANGPHHLVVSVVDAAGNSAPVLDRNINVENPGVPGPPNGIGASAQASLVARWQTTATSTLRTGYGRRETIRGRLTNAQGTPISGAVIDVSATPSYSGAKSAAMKSPRTGSDGRFTLSIPAGASSRTVELAYRAHLGDAQPVASKALRLSVRASLSLQISPRTASAGSTIRFSGRLRGGPIPHGGKPLVLEARSGGAWIEFDVIRSDRHGRYHAGYTFKFPGPARYQFRVLCEAEADYPFAAGSSPVLGVAEH